MKGKVRQAKIKQRKDRITFKCAGINGIFRGQKMFEGRSSIQLTPWSHIDFLYVLSLLFFGITTA